MHQDLVSLSIFCGTPLQNVLCYSSKSSTSMFPPSNPHDRIGRHANLILQQQSLMSEFSPERILTTIKWINIITSVSIIVFSVTGVIYLGITNILSAKFFMVFSPIFMTLFGVLLLATQCKFDFVLRCVGFLRSLLGRGIFNIYLASEVFYFFSCGTGDGVLGWVFGVALFGLGILYIVLQFCGGSEYREELKRRLEQ